MQKPCLRENMFFSQITKCRWGRSSFLLNTTYFLLTEKQHQKSIGLLKPQNICFARPLFCKIFAQSVKVLKSDYRLPNKIPFICFNESPLKLMKNAF